MKRRGPTHIEFDPGSMIEGCAVGKHAVGKQIVSELLQRPELYL